MARAKEYHTGDMEVGQKPDLDITLGQSIDHGADLPNVLDDNGKLSADKVAYEAFMEEPVTIRIEENSRADFPETHAPVCVNGKGAEILLENGKWASVTWLPIGRPLTTKRKYVEVLARAKTDSVKTVHEDGSVDKPRNTLQRRSSTSYPMSVIMDKNPRGHEWLSNILMGY